MRVCKDKEAHPLSIRETLAVHWVGSNSEIVIVLHNVDSRPGTAPTTEKDTVPFFWGGRSENSPLFRSCHFVDCT